MTDNINIEIKDLLESTSKQVNSIHESVGKLLDSVGKLLEVHYGSPKVINGSPRVFQTTPKERIDRAKRVADGWTTFCNHPDADHISSYALAGIIGVSQPWCLHMINCRRELIELGKDPKGTPWAEARTVVDR